MALLDNLLQIKLLSLACPVDDLGLVLLQIDVADLNQVPEVVIRPEELSLPAFQLMSNVFMREQTPHRLQWSEHIPNNPQDAQ